MNQGRVCAAKPEGGVPQEPRRLQPELSLRGDAEFNDRGATSVCTAASVLEGITRCEVVRNCTGLTHRKGMTLKVAAGKFEVIKWTAKCDSSCAKETFDADLWGWPAEPVAVKNEVESRSTKAGL